MTTKRNPGPFLNSFFIADKQIDRIAKACLEAVSLMPTSPGPVAIEKYPERRWRISEDYEDLPPGCLGCAWFSESGLVGLSISRELGEDTSRTGIVRTRSTLAHEIGHGELHAAAYAEKLRFDASQMSLFGEIQEGRRGFMCREDQISRPRNDEWWEIQANKFMAATLLPKHLLRQVVENRMAKRRPDASFPLLAILETEVADVFTVSYEMARIGCEAMIKVLKSETLIGQAGVPQAP